MPRRSSKKIGRADDSIEELAVEDLIDREDTATKVPRPAASVQELDSSLLEDEDSAHGDADATDADATVVGTMADLHPPEEEEAEPTVIGSLHEDDAEPTVFGSLHHAEKEDAEDDAEPTVLGSLVDSELTEKIKPIRKKDPEAEPATNKIAPRRSDVAEQKIEALLSRLEETALSREKARIFKQIAAIFKDDLGDEAQAFDALLEAFNAYPEDRDTKAKLETLGRKLGRVGEISSAMGMGSGEFAGLRALEANLRAQKKISELGEVLEKEVEAAPDRDAKIRHALAPRRAARASARQAAAGDRKVRSGDRIASDERCRTRWSRALFGFASRVGRSRKSDRGARQSDGESEREDEALARARRGSRVEAKRFSGGHGSAVASRKIGQT